MEPSESKFKFRAVFPIIREAGLGYATIIFFSVYLVASAIITFVEPDVTFGDAAWICFQALTTIGFGDIPITTTVSRIAIVALSLISIFYLAIITGIVVAYCTEMMRQRADESVAQHLSDLENLDKLSPQELKELSAKIKRENSR